MQAQGKHFSFSSIHSAKSLKNELVIIIFWNHRQVLQRASETSAGGCGVYIPIAGRGSSLCVEKMFPVSCVPPSG